MSNSSIRLIDRILSGVTTPGQNGPGSNGNEGLLHIPLSSSITGASSSDCFVSYPGHSFRGGSYPSAEKQSVHSLALTYWAVELRVFLLQDWLPYKNQRTKSGLLSTHSRRKNIWLLIFLKGIKATWNKNSLIQDLNLGHGVYFLQRELLNYR